MSWVTDLSLILFNTSSGIYFIPKESNYTSLFLLINNETQCIHLLFLSSKSIAYASALIISKVFLEKKNIKPTIIHKIFETNSSFHVKQWTMGKVQFLFFRSFFASTDTVFNFWRGLNTRQYLCEVLRFSWYLLIC